MHEHALQGLQGEAHPHITIIRRQLCAAWDAVHQHALHRLQGNANLFCGGHPSGATHLRHTLDQAPCSPQGTFAACKERPVRVPSAPSCVMDSTGHPVWQAGRSA